MKLKPVVSWMEVPVVMDLSMASRIVGQSAEYLKKRAQSGTFPAFKEGNCWRISKSALMKHVGEEGTN